jgi:hypothetical protein
MPVVMDSWKEQKGNFLGYRFRKEGKPVCGEMKCPICGKWFSWSLQNIERYILEKRWDEKRGEPSHCGNSLCWDYHIRWLKHVEKMRASSEYRAENFIERQKRRFQKTERDAHDLFLRLKARGVVA